MGNPGPGSGVYRMVPGLVGVPVYRGGVPVYRGSVLPTYRAFVGVGWGIFGRITGHRATGHRAGWGPPLPTRAKGGGGGENLKGGNVTEYKGGCSTAAAVFGLFGFMMLVGALVVFGGRIVGTIENAKTARVEAQADRAYQEAQAANFELEERKAELAADIERQRIELERLREQNSHELDKQWQQQVILDHNLTLFALAAGNAALAEQVQTATLPQEPEPEPAGNNGTLWAVLWMVLITVAGLLIGLVLLVALRAWRRPLL